MWNNAKQKKVPKLTINMNRKRSKNNAFLSDDRLTGFRIGDANSFYEVVLVLDKIRTHW